MSRALRSCGKSCGVEEQGHRVSPGDSKTILALCQRHPSGRLKDRVGAGGAKFWPGVLRPVTCRCCFHLSHLTQGGDPGAEPLLLQPGPPCAAVALCWAGLPGPRTLWDGRKWPVAGLWDHPLSDLYFSWHNLNPGIIPWVTLGSIPSMVGNTCPEALCAVDQVTGLWHPLLPCP